MASRGGFANGGGGFAGRGGVPGQGGFAGGRSFVSPGRPGMAFARPSLARPPFGPGVRFNRPQIGSYPSTRTGVRTSQGTYGNGPPFRRPSNFHRDRPFFSPLGRSPRRGYGFRGYPGSLATGFAYPGFFDLGFLDPYWDDAGGFGYDQTSPESGQDLAEGAYDASPGGAYPDPQPQSGGAYEDPGAAPETNGGGPPDDGPQVYAPYAYGPPQGTGFTLPAPPREEDAVTIFFRDGRLPEQIRNYALTRSTLLITDGRMREIPLGEINLPLTVRVNRALGIDFQLPSPE